MKPFNANFFISHDPLILSEGKNSYYRLDFYIPYLIQYLKNKYQTNITLAIRGYQKDTPTPIFLDLPSMLTGNNQWEIGNDIIYFKKNYLDPIRKRAGDYREAFVFGKHHATLLVYIKEGTQEALLLLDSKGSNQAPWISNATKVTTYSLTKGRQINPWGCYLDAIVLARDLTAKDEQSGQYKLINLLSQLQLRNHTIEKLPDVLLKSAESKKFIAFYRDPNRPLIHKNQTLDFFRARYTEKNVLVKKGEYEEAKVSDISNYLRKKSIHYVDNIEIQFYLHQIESEIGCSLSQKDKNEFIHLAKTELKAQGNIRVNKNRPGLFELAKNFLLSYKALHSTQEGQEEAPKVNPKIFVTGPENSLEKIAQSYNLPNTTITQLQNQIKVLIEKYDNFESPSYEELELFNHPQNGLAATEILLLLPQSRGQHQCLFYVAALSLEHADIVLNCSTLMDKQSQENLLGEYVTRDFYYQLFSINAYLAKKGLELNVFSYEDNFYQALNWIANKENTQGFIIHLFEENPPFWILNSISEEDILIYPIQGTGKDSSDSLAYFCKHKNREAKFEKIFHKDELGPSYFIELKSCIFMLKQQIVATLSLECQRKILDLLSSRIHINSSKRLDIQLEKRATKEAVEKEVFFSFSKSKSCPNFLDTKREKQEQSYSPNNLEVTYPLS